MRRYLGLLIITLGLAAPSLAQPRPGAFTTATVTDTGANALSVGCAVGSTTCTGGIDAGALLLSNTGAASIDTEGGITAGSGNVGIIDTSGRIPAISSTYFASLSGANLTAIPETAIADGAILARYAEAAPFTGTVLSWTESGSQISLGHQTGSSGARLQINAASGQNGYITFTESTVADRWAIGINGGSGALNVRLTDPSGTVVTQWQPTTGNLLHQFGLALSGTATGATLAAGGNHNYNPTNLATSFFVPVAANAASSSLTGLVAQTAGHLRVLCNTPSTGGTLTILPEDGNSTAANRFTNTAVLAPNDCAWVWYNTAVSRWHIIATTV